MGGSDSSSASSSSGKKKTKKGEKKVKKKEKKKDAKKQKQMSKKGSKRKLASSSGSSSASSGKKKKKKEKKDKKEKKQKADSKDEAQQRWIFGREKAIRKADPAISKEEALRQAVEEYCTLYSDGKPDRPAEASHEPAAEKLITSADDIENERVREAVEQAIREAREAGKAAGKDEAAIELDAAKARASVLKVAEQNGLYTPPAAPRGMSLFLQEKDKELDEYVRKGMPSTDDRPRTAEQQVGAPALDFTRIRVLPGM